MAGDYGWCCAVSNAFNTTGRQLNGAHFCLGAQPAVAQMWAMFIELTRRYDTVEPAAPPRYLRSNFQRGVKSLPIRWRTIIQ